mgnify:FL=1
MVEISAEPNLIFVGWQNNAKNVLVLFGLQHTSVDALSDTYDLEL